MIHNRIQIVQRFVDVQVFEPESEILQAFVYLKNTWYLYKYMMVTIIMINKYIYKKKEI